MPDSSPSLARSAMLPKDKSTLKTHGLTWSLTPHSPSGGFAHKALAPPLLPLSPITTDGLTPKPHHAHESFSRLRGSFRLRLASTFNHRPDSPAALIIPPFQSVGNMFFLQKIIYVSCFFACHVGSEARENLFCVFYGIILNLPVLHRMLTNAVCFVLSFILKGCLFFRFCFIPHMPDFAKTASAGI